MNPMTTQTSTVLVVGATGSIGRLVVAEAIRSGYAVRALVRDPGRARGLPPQAQQVVGDLTRPNAMLDAVDGIDAIVFTQGSHGSAEGDAERVDYGGVRNALFALRGRNVRVALMTAIGVTKRTEGHDWKRRAERLVRASGLPYTIVRPGWFDYNGRDEQRLVLLQGDTRHAGDPSDGAVARSQIAEVLVSSLTSTAAERKTFELVAEHGSLTQDFDALFAPLDSDPPGALDAVRDIPNLPLSREPERVRKDLDQITAR